MRRVLATSLTALSVLAVGCGETSYKFRREQTLELKKYQAQLENNLSPPVAEKFKDLNVFLRPPKGMDKTPQPLVNVPAGMFDAAESFVGVPASTATAKGATPAPVKLHVFVRTKKVATVKKGEAPPPPRGKFSADVLTLLAQQNGADVSPDAKLQKENFKSTDFLAPSEYQRVIIKAPATNSTIQAFFSTVGNYETALVWELPPGVSADPARRLTMASFAVGKKAQHYFEGGLGDEESAGKGAATETPI